MATLDEGFRSRQQELAAMRLARDKAVWSSFVETAREMTRLQEAQQAVIEQSLPYFWFFVIMNSNWAARYPPTEADACVLQHLRRVSIGGFEAHETCHTYLPEQKSLRVRYTVVLSFAPNALLSCTELSKTIEFTMTASDRRDIVVMASGSGLTSAYYQLATDEPSFFEFFDPVDEDEQTVEGLEQDFDTCEDISKELIPYALEYFKSTGTFEEEDIN